jgi:hypothetical protein
MGQASGLVGVVAPHGALLFPIALSSSEGALDRGVEIQHPGCTQERLRSLGPGADSTTPIPPTH